MAFSFANMVSGATKTGDQSSSGAQVQDGEELKEIQTAQLGFKTINAEVKARLFSSPWSLDDPPTPSAQLLSVASSQGILAAAGPDKLIIASTEKLRETLSAKEGDNVRDLVPIVTISQDKLTHVAFSSDDSVLVVAGPSTGGLIAYQVDKLKSGQAEAALTITTPTPLRALVPNPNPASAHLFAAVTSEGLLLLADLSNGQLVQGPSGTTLSEGVVCAAWSNRGKQIVAGTTSAVATQLKPDGQVVARVPKSTSIPNDTHISSIMWLEDDTFFVIYTPNSTNAEDGIPPSEYYIIERSNKTNFTFHKLPEVLPPFGVERLPTHHFINRLRKFDPHITDILLLAATTATDIGILTKSTEPLSASDNPEDLVANKFTLTTLEDDTKRAALPLSPETSMDTSPIGMAIDLSSKDPVINPLPSDPEVQETEGPVPSLLVLNHEGLLCSWWVIYVDSVKQNTTFSGFESLQAAQQVRSAVSPPSQSEQKSVETQSATTFSQAATPTSATFPQPATANTTSASLTGFGATAGGSGFGAPKSQSSWSSTGFGGSSKIGEDKSSWIKTGFADKSGSSSTGPSFGQTGFGQSGFGQPAFGSASAVGKPSGFGQPTTPAFGKTGFGGGSTSSPFASATGTSTGSGFASFAGSGGFGTSSAKRPESGTSPFAKPATESGFSSFAGTGGFGSAFDKKSESRESPFAKQGAGSGFGGFGQKASSDNTFAKATSSNSFAQTTNNFSSTKSQGFAALTGNNSQSPFGTGSPFKLDSSFKGDGTAKDDLPKPSGGSTFGFGQSFENLLGGNKKDDTPVQTAEADMEDQESPAEKTEASFTGFSPEQSKTRDEGSKTFTTPPSTIVQTKSTPAPPVSTLFGPLQSQTTTPQQPFTSTGFSFTSTTPKETPAASNTMFATKPTITPTPAFVQKSEPVMSFSAAKSSNFSEKKTETLFSRPGDTPRKPLDAMGAKPTNDLKRTSEVPLPPDPLSKPGFSTGDTSSSSSNSKVSKEPEDAPLPPDFLPANTSAIKEVEDAPLPMEEPDADDDEFTSDFDEDSGEDVTQDISPGEEVDEQHDEDEEEATTEQIQTSPETSFRGDDTTSPTGGLFTKVTTNDKSQPARPLFGEIGRSAPIFPPPKPQQSPRSPSPVRQFLAHDNLRSENRSVSAPIRTQSAINQRKAEYAQSAIAMQAAKAREDEIAREKAKLEAARLSAERARIIEQQILEDDETERIQKELALPVQPSSTLDEFITYQAESLTETSKADIPAQIERLYQDINSMVCTLGINVRSLTSFMMHENGQTQNRNWPQILQSDAPMDAINEPWLLNDIHRLREGSLVLSNSVDQNQVHAVPQKLESCQTLLTKDLFDLRTKVTAIRKSLHARAHSPNLAAPLSAEQSSVQHDLRKASALVQTKLVQIEDGLAVMQVRLSEVSAKPDSTKGMFSSQTIQRKPTVEAVFNTIAKMTSMAEKKSADVDVLEAQLRKLDTSFGTSPNGSGNLPDHSTPQRPRSLRIVGTPASAASSAFYTPDSKLALSARSTRSSGPSNLTRAVVSGEDRDRWRTKAARRKEVAITLKAILTEKRKPT